MEKIDVIQVTVQSAEVTLVGHDAAAQLVINGTLKNVARGHVVLNIQSRKHVHVGGIGTLDIEHARPVMQANLSIDPNTLQLLLDQLRGSPPRPATVVLALAAGLHLSDEGFLLPDLAGRQMITDMSWNFPIQ